MRLFAEILALALCLAPAAEAAARGPGRTQAQARPAGKPPAAKPGTAPLPPEALKLQPPTVPAGAPTPSPERFQGSKSLARLAQGLGQASRLGPKPAEPRAEHASRHLGRAFDGGPKPKGGVSFFFNDHDASRHYETELRSFIFRHDQVLIESLRGGKPLRLFQRVSDGALLPSLALPGLQGRDDPMDKALLKALHRSRAKVLPEPMYGRKRRNQRRLIDGELLPQAAQALGQAYEAFVEDGDAAQAAKRMKLYNGLMARVHALREEALLSEIIERLKASRVRLGVIFGMFHAWPYEALKAAGVAAASEFHPPAPDEGSRILPYNRPLELLRLKPGRRESERDRRDSLSFILLYDLLDKRFRAERGWAEKTRLYNAIISRMSLADMAGLSRELALFHEELRSAHPEDRLSLFTLRWLLAKGFIEPGERRFFLFQINGRSRGLTPTRK